MNQDIQARLENDFTYHRCSVSDINKMADLRMRLHQVAELTVNIVPPGREQALALTKLEEAMMWANAGIARSSQPEVLSEGPQ